MGNKGLKIILNLFLALIVQIRSAVNPMDYIWVNYDAKMPLIPQSEAFYTVQLPCQTQIGQCIYQFTYLPTGWKLNKNGTFSIPSSDTKGINYFGILGRFSEISGQSMKVNLMIKISNNILTVQDMVQFLKSSGQSIENIQPTVYQENRLTRQLPAGFPSFDQVTKKLNDLSGPEIKNYIVTLFLKKGTCVSETKYFTRVSSIFDSKISQTEAKIADYNNKIKLKQQQIADMKQKKVDYFKKEGITQQITLLNEQINQTKKAIADEDGDEQFYRNQMKYFSTKINNYYFNLTESQKGRQDIQILYNSTQAITDRLIQKWAANRLQGLMSQIRLIPVEKLTNTIQNLTKWQQIIKNIVKNQTVVYNLSRIIDSTIVDQIKKVRLSSVIQAHLSQIKSVSSGQIPETTSQTAFKKGFLPFVQYFSNKKTNFAC